MHAKVDVKYHLCACYSLCKTLALCGEQCLPSSIELHQVCHPMAYLGSFFFPNPCAITTINFYAGLSL